MRAIFVAARVDDEDFCHSEFSHCPNIVLWQNEENIWIKWKNIWIKCYVDANILRTAIIVQSKHGGPIYSTLPLNPGPGIGSMLTNLLNWMIAKWFNHQQQYYLSIPLAGVVVSHSIVAPNWFSFSDQLSFHSTCIAKHLPRGRKISFNLKVDHVKQKIMFRVKNYKNVMSGS